MAMDEQSQQSLITQLQAEFRADQQRLELMLKFEREQRLASIEEVRQAVDTVGASIVEGLTILGSEVESIIALVMHLKNTQGSTSSDPAPATSDAGLPEAEEPISPRSADRRRMMESFDQLGQQLTSGCRSQLSSELRRASKDLQASISAMESKMRAELQTKLDDAVKSCMVERQEDVKEVGTEEDIAVSPSSRVGATSASIDFGSEDLASPTSARSILERSPLDPTESRSILEEQMLARKPQALGELEDTASTPDTVPSVAEKEVPAAVAAETVSMISTLSTEDELRNAVAGPAGWPPAASPRQEPSPAMAAAPLQIGARVAPCVREAALSPRRLLLPGMNPDLARPSSHTYQVPLPVAVQGSTVALRTISPQRIPLRSGSVQSRQPGAAPWGIRGPPSSSQLQPSPPPVSSPYLSTTLADTNKMPQKEQEAARLGAMRLAVAQSRASPPSSARRPSKTRLEI